MFNSKLKMKKRAYPEQERIMNKRLSADSNSEPVNNTIVPDGEEFKVGEAVKDIQNIREGSRITSIYFQKFWAIFPCVSIVITF